MEILVLGDSDTSGRFTAGVSWPQLLQASLGKRLEQPVSVHTRGLSAVPPDAWKYAEKCVAEMKPDSVVLLVGTFGFTAKFTWLRVQQLFGKRAGRWYRRIEERFDSNTREASGTPRRVNVWARAAVRKLVRGKSLSTRERVTENYRAIFRALSRAEDAQVVILIYPGLGQHARTGKGPELRRKFLVDMREAADQMRFGWVDLTPVFAAHKDQDSLRIDDLHFSAEGHALIAAALEESVAQPTVT